MFSSCKESSGKVAGLRLLYEGLLAKVEGQVDTLCLLVQPKERQQQIKKKNKNRTARKSNFMEVPQPRTKKKHSFRLVGGLEMGSRGREDVQQGKWLEDWGRQGSGWQTRSSHIYVDKLGGTTGE